MGYVTNGHSTGIECKSNQSIEYTWTIPFDMQGLIDKMGGPDATEKRLDLMFVPNLRTTDLGVGVGSGTTLFNPGK